MSNETKIPEKSGRPPTFKEAIGFLIVTIAILAVFCICLPSVETFIPLTFCIIIGCFYALYLGYSWSDVEKILERGVAAGSFVYMMELLIGATIASWIVAGIVPYMINLGMMFLNPQWFLPLTFIISAISGMLVSSFTTVGTIGLALLGTGIAMGVPAPMTAGAVLCGAMFGDKQSPLAESTVFAARNAGTTLSRHCGSMLWSTVPAAMVTLTIYTVINFNIYETLAFDATQADQIITTFSGLYKFYNPVLIIPIIVTFVLISRKVSALIALTVAVIMGFVVAVFLQGISPTTFFELIYSNARGTTGVNVVDTILGKGGLVAIFPSVGLVMAALALGGIFEGTNTLRSIVDHFAHVLNTGRRMCAAAMASTAFFIFITGDSKAGSVICGTTFGEPFDQKGIDRRCLSRILEDFGTVVSPLIPWGFVAGFFAALLEVDVYAYIPYYFLGWLTPLFSIVLVATGIGIYRADGTKGWK